MVSFTQVHEFFKNVIEEMDSAAKKDLSALASELRSGFAAQEAAIVQKIVTDAVAGATPEKIAEDTLKIAETVIQAILVAHGL